MAADPPAFNQVLPVNGTVNFIAPGTPSNVGGMTAAKAAPLVEKPIG